MCMSFDTPIIYTDLELTLWAVCLFDSGGGGGGWQIELNCYQLIVLAWQSEEAYQMFNKHIHCAIELLCQLLYGCWLQVLLVTYWWYGRYILL